MALCLTAGLAGACGTPADTIGDRGTAGRGGAGTGGSAGAPSNSGDTGGGAGAPELPAAAAGFSLSLSKPDASFGGRECYAGTTGAFTYAIGAPEPGHTVESGTDGAYVNCSVAMNADKTAELITAQISGDDANGSKPVSISVTAQAPVGDLSATVPATLTFFSPDTNHLNTLAQFPGCTLGPFTVLKQGAMLADIDCPLIGSDDDSTSGCKVHGTVAIEYCKTNAATDPSSPEPPTPAP